MKLLGHPWKCIDTNGGSPSHPHTHTYSFQFNLPTGTVDYAKMFNITPSHSTLYPGEKAQAVSIAFRADREVTIKDQPILKCQVIDSHVGEQGEIIANIPIRISAKAVFSK